MKKKFFRLSQSIPAGSDRSHRRNDRMQSMIQKNRQSGDQLFASARRALDQTAESTQHPGADHGDRQGFPDSDAKGQNQISLKFRDRDFVQNFRFKQSPDQGRDPVNRLTRFYEFFDQLMGFMEMSPNVGIVRQSNFLSVARDIDDFGQSQKFFSN